MKTAFFCSCLEPGKDGVGDYMRQLALACREQSGDELLLVALNDGSLERGEKKREETQSGLRTIRLGADISWDEKFLFLEGDFSAFAPEVVSFHYVPFAFHPKGLARDWPEVLGKLFAGRKIHWMFHELWLGAYIGAPWKERLLGWMQKRGVKKVVDAWSPAAIHTSNPGYVALLNDAGIPAGRLRMYGAIPEGKPGGDVDLWFRDLMKGCGLDFTAAEREDYWFGMFFGTLHANWPHEPLFSLLANAAEVRRKKMVILSLGYLRTGSVLWERLQRDYGDRFRFVLLGQRSEEEIAFLFKAVDFGLTSSPSNILGKSSAAAAMWDHGLPVLVNWEGRPLRLKSGRRLATEQEDLLWPPDGQLGKKLGGIDRTKRRYDPQLPKSAQQVIQDLEG